MLLGTHVDIDRWLILLWAEPRSCSTQKFCSIPMRISLQLWAHRKNIFCKSAKYSSSNFRTLLGVVHIVISSRHSLFYYKTTPKKGQCNMSGLKKLIANRIKIWGRHTQVLCVQWTTFDADADYVRLVLECQSSSTYTIKVALLL